MPKHTVAKALKNIDENYEFQHMPDDWQTLKSFVLVQLSPNSRYEAAMAVYVEYCEAAAPEFKETFDNWLRGRLHLPKASNVS